MGTVTVVGGELSERLQGGAGMLDTLRCVGLPDMISRSQRLSNVLLHSCDTSSVRLPTNFKYFAQVKYAAITKIWGPFIVCNCNKTLALFLKNISQVTTLFVVFDAPVCSPLHSIVPHDPLHKPHGQTSSLGVLMQNYISN